MVQLPRIPQAWKDQSASAPPDASRPDLNDRSGGILDGWQPLGWSLEGSGPGFLLDPETIAQIDFGDKDASPPMQAPVSIAGKLTQEGSYRFLPENSLNMNEHDGYRIAQAGGPLPYPLRQAPIPRFEPYNMPGMNRVGKERATNLKEALENMKDSTEIGEDLREIGSRAGQVNVQSNFDADLHSQYNMPIVQFRQSYVVSGDSIAPVGKGNTWRTPDGKYYVDRNGDTHPDIEIKYDKTGKAYVNYGDGRGSILFDRKT